MCNITPQDKGRQFENTLHHKLLQTRSKVMREAEIKRYFGKNVSGIDHLVYNDEYLICIQDKWQKSAISISQFNHYSKCVEEISKFPEILNNPNIKILAIYVSNQHLSGNTLEQFNIENDRYKNKTSRIKYYNCSDDNEDIIFRKIEKFLHNKKIFLYDYEDDCIMKPI